MLITTMIIEEMEELVHALIAVKMWNWMSLNMIKLRIFRGAE